MSLLATLNEEFLNVHIPKEESYWAEKMGLSKAVAGECEKREIAWRNFAADASYLPRIRAALATAEPGSDEAIGLEGWLRYFTANAVESDEAKALLEKIIQMEAELQEARRTMQLGYVHPHSGEFIPAGSVELGLKMITEKDEAMRRAMWEGLASIEPLVLEKGFIEVIRERNRLGRMLGYEDYYDYKVTINEGFSKKRLFELLDELEADTREACRATIEETLTHFGDNARRPWNFDYYTSGDVTDAADPYLQFSSALETWGRSFAAMGIDYCGASMTLDLVARKGKYENGFMHGPFPGYVDGSRFRPAKINFTANAVPGQKGSGKRAIETLIHEGGHAAHFSNIKMPAPCFSQEFSPTSVALAELQSMFLESVTGDADWLTRYARDAEGRSMPREIIRMMLRRDHVYRALQLRRLLLVSYAEKFLYELPAEQLQPEIILAGLRDIERRLLFIDKSPRPVLSIPHLISGESSAYYHGYTLAKMAVYQTREYFLRKDGRIMDNPNIGRELAAVYWQPGNSKSFPELVEELTGEPFSAKATVRIVNTPLEEVYTNADKMIEQEQGLPRFEGPIELNADISVVHGDKVIARCTGGQSFEEMHAQFSRWILAQESARNAD